MHVITAAESVQLLRSIDTITLGFGPVSPAPFMDALHDRDDWQNLTIYSAMLLSNYDVLSHPTVQLRSSFF